jgi:chromosome segregation ATPase
MTRILPYFNFLGVMALTGLSVVQWQNNRHLNLNNIALEQVRMAQADKLEENDRTIKGEAADLDEFRGRLALSESQLKDTEDKLAAVTRDRDHVVSQRDQLAGERDQLKAALATWQAAVAARDEALQKANDDAAKLIADRNDAVNKFNDLAGKYNGVVKDLNDAAAKFNDLVEKYNGVVKDLNEARAKKPGE